MQTEDSDRLLLASVANLADRDVAPAADVEDERARTRARLFGEPGEPSRRRRYGRRPSRHAAYVMFGVLLFGASAATAGVLTFGQEEVESLANDRGISLEASRAQLIDERGLDRLTVGLRAAFGDRFGGIWVDNGTITMALTGAPSDSDRRLVKTSAAAASIASVVRVVEHRYSERELVELVGELQRQVDLANQGAGRPIEVEPDVTRGVVVVRRPKPESLTTNRQQEWLEELPKFGSIISVSEGNPPLQLYSAK